MFYLMMMMKQLLMLAELLNEKMEQSAIAVNMMKQQHKDADFEPLTPPQASELLENWIPATTKKASCVCPSEF